MHHATLGPLEEGGQLGSLEPGRRADLLIIDKDRIFFPPGRFDAEPFLDVVLDRADSGDIDVVMAHGRVLMEGGRVTIVDEARVRERFAEAEAQRVYRPGSRTIWFRRACPGQSERHSPVWLRTHR